MSSKGQSVLRAQEAAEAMGIDFDPVKFNVELPPSLTVEGWEYWHAFSLLTRTRTFTDGGPQYISLVELMCYIRDVEEIDHPDQKADIIYFVKALDDTYVSLVNKS